MSVAAPLSVRDSCSLGLVVLLTGLTFLSPAFGQMPEGEHESHHPRGSEGGAPAAQPPAFVEQGERSPGAMGMMEHMGAPPRKELYPSLIELPDLPPERRADVERRAQEQMRAGMAAVSEGWELLSHSAASHDYASMEAAEERLREGLTLVESGVAAQRALNDGSDPRKVALQWFKREMNLPPPSEAEGEGPFGLTWFHVFVMALLTTVSVGALWIYVGKTRRAGQLLRELTGVALLPQPTTAIAATVPAAPSGAAVALSGEREESVPLAKPQRWSGRLRVGRIFEEAPDVKTFRLLNPLGGGLPFTYLPGQFLTVAVAPDGRPVKRSYTIASSPTQRDYAELTVKHEEGGVVSGFLHGRVREGDLLDCSGPLGSFIFTGRECQCILLVGGGVGITPLMSVLRYLTDRAWPGDIFLIYGCHSPRDIIFRTELEYLQRRHPNLRVVVTVSHPEGTDWKGPTGRITKELITASVPDLASRYVHLCGPVPMMEAAKRILAELGVPRERVKTEAFGPALGRPEPTRLPPELPVAAERAARPALATVTFSLSDKSAPLPPDTPILDVADDVGVEIDNSCREGICGLCRVKLLSGKVTMAVEEGLEPGDKENNIVLACQAKSTGDVTVEA